MPQVYDPRYSQDRSNETAHTILKISALIGLILGAVIIPAIFGVDPEGATKVLQANGYKNITITGYKWFNGTHDFYNTGFDAVSPNGTNVSGYVSRGIIFKGSTIRFD
jgi:hypothetical protein